MRRWAIAVTKKSNRVRRPVFCWKELKNNCKILSKILAFRKNRYYLCYVDKVIDSGGNRINQKTLTTISTSRIFRKSNADQNDSDYNKIFVIDSEEITALYNVYGLYTKNPDFDGEDEGEPEFKCIQDTESYLVDKDGTWVRETYMGQVSWGDTETFYSSEDGVTFVEETGTPGTWDCDCYTYWDGSNHKIMTMKSEAGHCDWEEITDKLGDDFEDRIKEIGRDSGQYGTHIAYIDPKDKKGYLYYESRFAGPDFYAEVTEGLKSENVLADGFDSEVDGDTAEFFVLFRDGATEIESDEIGTSQLYLQEYEGTYIFSEIELQLPSSDMIKVFYNKEKAESVYQERKAELESIEQDN